MIPKKKQILPLITILLALTLASLKFASQEFSYSEHVDLNSLNRLKADINFQAGSLYISSHNSSIAEFKSVYTRKSFKAEIELDSKKEHLIIHQPEENNLNMKEGDKNDWRIKLPKALPADLKLKLGTGEGIIDLSNSKISTMELDAGAGKFELNLANTSLSNLNVNAGVGSLIIDLSGKRNKNLKGTINGGIGEIKLVFPSMSGVRVKVHGLGDIDKGNLIKQNGYYVNQLYGKASNNIDVSVNGGLGKIELRLK